MQETRNKRETVLAYKGACLHIHSCACTHGDVNSICARAQWVSGETDVSDFYLNTIAVFWINMWVRTWSRNSISNYKNTLRFPPFFQPCFTGERTKLLLKTFQWECRPSTWLRAWLIKEHSSPKHLVVSSVLQVLLVYGLFIIGFGLAFYILFAEFVSISFVLCQDLFNANMLQTVNFLQRCKIEKEKPTACNDSPRICWEREKRFIFINLTTCPDMSTGVSKHLDRSCIKLWLNIRAY